jgi:D-3-phosphoglycerate dehydrogenase
VLFTPGVNETTVAEHTVGLMIAVAKHFWFHARAVKGGRWDRRTGAELWGKTLGVVGLGRVGREVVKRARAMGMSCIGYGSFWEADFSEKYGVDRCVSLEELLGRADVVSLHTNLTPETRGLINRRTIALMKNGAILVNTGRGGLVVEQDVADACRSGKLYGYGADVLETEPMKTPHVFQEVDNIIITPHVGSRTNESVQRQGLRAANNLVNFLTGDSDYLQANRFE